MSGYTDGTAIAGIGATTFSKDSGRSELHLAVEAITGAMSDAGLPVDSIDGLVTFDMDNNDQTQVCSALGLGDITFFSTSPFGGGGACMIVQQAAMAVHAGLADTIVCYRAFNERSGNRFGQYVAPPAHPSAAEVRWSWHGAHGLITPAGLVAMSARRYMHEYGATSEDFGRIAVIERANAATNPAAWFYQQPITLEEHQASRWIAEPLRLLDCCQESDGGVALVVTSLERARDLQHKPVMVRAAAQGMSSGQQVMSSFYRSAISGLPEMGLVGRQLWEQSGLAPSDIQALILYDHFTPFVLSQLEALGFCSEGEAKELVRSGALALDGKWPLNPHGGLLGEAYIHGVNGILEAVRQIRGNAVNQVADIDHVLVTAGTGVPTSGLILGVA